MVVEMGERIDVLVEPIEAVGKVARVCAAIDWR
jgi:hypothetical protein